MRQKAEKLEKGKWYADISSLDDEAFLLYSHLKDNRYYFSKQIGADYAFHLGFISITMHSNWYLPTPEDIEKYNLNEEEI